MKTKAPANSFRAIARKSLLAILYALALFLSVQIPTLSLQQGQSGQLAFEQQSFCLIPFEEHSIRTFSNTVIPLSVVFLTVPEFLNGFKFRTSVTNSLFDNQFTPVVLGLRKIVITMRRLRL